MATAVAGRKKDRPRALPQIIQVAIIGRFRDLLDVMLL
jgi:hypothetical protein